MSASCEPYENGKFLKVYKSESLLTLLVKAGRKARRVSGDGFNYSTFVHSTKNIINTNGDSSSHEHSTSSSLRVCVTTFKHTLSCSQTHNKLSTVVTTVQHSAARRNKRVISAASRRIFGQINFHQFNLRTSAISLV